MKSMDRMKELAEILNRAAESYYAKDTEIMSNFEYDKLYGELERLEKVTGVILSNSPTAKVGYEAAEELPKERHEQPMLSLDKTKNREELQEWVQDKTALLSWKLDGLTVVLSYHAGKLAKAVTRGNGEVGEVITANVKTFKNIPLSIPFQGELVLRGEAVISYADFERINEDLKEEDAKYKNPRNLCSGSVRQLNNEITAKRSVQFFAFGLVFAEEASFQNSRKQQLEFLKLQGFDVVEYREVNRENILENIQYFEKAIQTFDIPSDGLVLTFDDIAYGQSLGRTAKFPRHSIAFKWEDEISETVLKDMEWSPSRTGLINPVAIFEPVELEGTTVSRASVHNISVLRSLKLGIGDKITVYKANMIIPQIAENLTGSDSIEIPQKCPVCGGQTEISQVGDAQMLYCTNPDCDAKKIKAFTLFVSRDALNMDGVSEATLEKFIAKGYIHEYADLFHLERYKDEITQMEGFGEKSYQNLIESIEKARNTTLPRLLYGLGIANIGVANAKMLCRQFQYNLEKLKNAEAEELSQIDGVGEVIAAAFRAYFDNLHNREKLERLLKEVRIEKPEEEGEQTLAGAVFVVTGSLHHFTSRNELKEEIERRGGKVTGSVTGKTVCLINNDITSNSGKNKKAKELNIPILTEEQFLEQYLKS